MIPINRHNADMRHATTNSKSVRRHLCQSGAINSTPPLSHDYLAQNVITCLDTHIQQTSWPTISSELPIFTLEYNAMGVVHHSNTVRSQRPNLYPGYHSINHQVEIAYLYTRPQRRVAYFRRSEVEYIIWE